MKDLEFGRVLPHGIEQVTTDVLSSSPPGFDKAVRTLISYGKGMAFGAVYFLFVEPHPSGWGWALFTISTMVLGPLTLWCLKVLWDRPKAERQILRRTVNQVKPSSLRTVFPDHNPIGFKQYIGSIYEKITPMKNRLEGGRTYFWSFLALLALGVIIRRLAMAFPEFSDHLYRMKRAYLVSVALLIIAPFLGALLHNLLRAIPRRSFLDMKDGTIHIRGRGRAIAKAIPDGYVGARTGEASEQYEKGLRVLKRLRERRANRERPSKAS